MGSGGGARVGSALASSASYHGLTVPVHSLPAGGLCVACAPSRMVWHQLPALHVRRQVADVLCGWQGLPPSECHGCLQSQPSGVSRGDMSRLGQGAWQRRWGGEGPPELCACCGDTWDGEAPPAGVRGSSPQKSPWRLTQDMMMVTRGPCRLCGTELLSNKKIFSFHLLRPEFVCYRSRAQTATHISLKYGHLWTF